MSNITPILQAPQRYKFSVSVTLSSPSGVTAGASAVFTFHGGPPTGPQLSKAAECVYGCADTAIDEAQQKGIL